MAARKTKLDAELVAEHAALRERVNAHDALFLEIKTDIRKILETTVSTNLAIAVLPTWVNVQARDKSLGEATQAVSERVEALETSASESRGSLKVWLIVAGVLGSVTPAVASWFISLFKP